MLGKYHQNYELYQNYAPLEKKSTSDGKILYFYENIPQRYLKDVHIGFQCKKIESK